MTLASQMVTARRRELIRQAVVFRHASYSGNKAGATVEEINATLKEWIAQRSHLWPHAPWPYARNEPYYTGTHQHLRAMERRVGSVTCENGRWRPADASAPDAAGLRRRAAEALRLQSEGKSQKQIAELLEGISRSLVSSLLADPTGEKERERKRGYCPSCGAKKAAEATVCPNCRQRKADELLPPQTFTRYIEQAREHGYELLFGVTTDYRRVIRVDVGRGYFEQEVRSDLTWSDAIGEIGEELGVRFD